MVVGSKDLSKRFGEDLNLLPLTRLEPRIIEPVAFSRLTFISSISFLFGKGNFTNTCAEAFAVIDIHSVIL
jgi:hypothetical protein